MATKLKLGTRSEAHQRAAAQRAFTLAIWECWPNEAREDLRASAQVNDPDRIAGWPARWHVEAQFTRDWASSLA
jgi:hypothetical protein